MRAFYADTQCGLLLRAVSILSSLILSKAQDSVGLGYSCLRWRADSDGQTRVSFIRQEEEEATGARPVYLSRWSDDMRLVTCDIITDPVVTERYRALCDTSQGPDSAPRFNVSALLAPDGPCLGATSNALKFAKRARSRGTTAGTRRKRAWILPGTLWCGRGSEAVRYEQLGMFENTDRCCREHDHCLHVIHPFRVNYGVFNPNFYAVSHCDCDQRFRECLLAVNDTISSMVGYSFFNILRVPCFELKQKRRCTEMYWWGMCKVAKEGPYAVFKPSLPYNASDTVSTVSSRNDTDKSTNGGQHVPDQLETSSHGGAPKKQRSCGSGDPPRGDTFHRRRTKGKACERQPAVTPSQMPMMSVSQSESPPVETSVPKRKALRTKKERVGNLRSTKNRRKESQQAANSFPQPSSATLSATQRPTHQLNRPTAITAVTVKTKASKHSGRTRKPWRDESRPRCKSCSKLKKTSHKATVTPATTTNLLNVSVTSLRTGWHRKTTKTSNREPLWVTTSFLAAVSKNQTAAASPDENDKPQKQVDFHQVQDEISQGPLGSKPAQSTHVEASLKPNHSLRNVTDNHLICESLKHLDECKYKIPPMEKKYDLQNVESKAVYHCDCTSRLADRFESFNQLSVLPTLLENYVSQFCFNLPKEKKCLPKKRCSEGFVVASDLLLAIKKTEVTDTQRKESRKDRNRGFPVRLYKRCLRLHMKLD